MGGLQPCGSDGRVGDFFRQGAPGALRARVMSRRLRGMSLKIDYRRYFRLFHHCSTCFLHSSSSFLGALHDYSFLTKSDMVVCQEHPSGAVVCLAAVKSMTATAWILERLPFRFFPFLFRQSKYCGYNNNKPSPSHHR